MKKALSVFMVLLAVLLFSNTQVYSQNMDSNKANLIVYRNGFIYGAWKNFDVVVDGKRMAGLNKNKAMHTFQLAPGAHHVAPGDEDKAVTLTMNAGQTYIVEYKVGFGILGAVPNLDIKTINQGKRDSKLVRNYLDKQAM